MKKVLTIFVLLCLLLQAAPVLQSAVNGADAFGLLVEEGAAGESTKEVKDDRSDDKLSTQSVFNSILPVPLFNSYNRHLLPVLPSPYLRQHTPPPNAC